MRSGAVGINLTSANYIFMLEPLMNPALDDQAVGRAWRMGQKRPVTVKRLFVKGTLEEGIMKIAAEARVRIPHTYSHTRTHTVISARLHACASVHCTAHCTLQYRQVLSRRQQQTSSANTNVFLLNAARHISRPEV